MNNSKGELKFIYKSATSEARPGSHMSHLNYEDKSRINSASGSFEVLTPDLSSTDWEMEIYLSDGQESPGEDNQEDGQGEVLTQTPDCTQIFGEKNIKNNTDITESKAILQVPSVLKDKTDNIKEENLAKAVEKMKALDEILQKTVAKEKEVKAQGLVLRKRLWEELQSLTKPTSLQSNDELINTFKFLALTPQINKVEDEANIEMDKVYESVFSTQPQSDDYDFHKTVQGDVSGSASDSLTNASSHQLPDEKKAKHNKKGTDFIKRNIELAKEAGSSFLLTEHEQLRLEQLLADIDIDSNEEDISEDICSIPGEGFTPDSDQCRELTKIEAELQSFQCDIEATETDNHGFSMTMHANVEPVLGEGLSNAAKMLREKKLRLRDIDQQIREIQARRLYQGAFQEEQHLEQPEFSPTKEKIQQEQWYPRSALEE
uniref:Fibrous sheath-interacting protein 1 n=1 Tax=Leptobrachium leishanense TaxID=445787 RepID=A0A8C5R8J7_9ANUR